MNRPYWCAMSAVILTMFSFVGVYAGDTDPQTSQKKEVIAPSIGSFRQLAQERAISIEGDVLAVEASEVTIHSLDGDILELDIPGPVNTDGRTYGIQFPGGVTVRIAVSSGSILRNRDDLAPGGKFRLYWTRFDESHEDKRQYGWRIGDKQFSIARMETLGGYMHDPAGTGMVNFVPLALEFISTVQPKDE